MIKLLGVKKLCFVPLAPSYKNMLTKNVASKHRKLVHPIDFFDQLNKDKATYDSISKSSTAACKQILFPSIDRPTEVPAQLLQEQGLEVIQSKELPSLACVSDYKVAVL